jgi:hypothetical protein
MSIRCPQCTGRRAALDGNWHLPLLSAATVLSVKSQTELEVNVTLLGKSWFDNQYFEKASAPEDCSVKVLTWPNSDLRRMMKWVRMHRCGLPKSTT